MPAQRCACSPRCALRGGGSRRGRRKLRGRSWRSGCEVRPCSKHRRYFDDDELKLTFDLSLPNSVGLRAVPSTESKY